MKLARKQGVLEPFVTRIGNRDFANPAFEEPKLDGAVLDGLLGKDDVHQKLIIIAAIEDNVVFEIANLVFGQEMANMAAEQHMAEAGTVEKRDIFDHHAGYIRNA